MNSQEKQAVADQDPKEDKTQQSPADTAGVTPSEKTVFELSQEELKGMPVEVKREAMRLLNSSDLLGEIIEDAADLGIAGEPVLFATIYLVATSLMLDKPLAVIVLGSSSSEKTFVVEVVLKLFVLRKRA